MNDSILTSIKKLLGIAEEYTHFDTDITMHINSVFFTLSQLGVGPTKGFSIKDAKNTWNEYLPDGELLNAVKTYVFLKVKIVFDPPTSSSVIEAYNKCIAEAEWRINVEAEYKEVGDTYEKK